jgi:uroporphyrinogen III methyltransferase / synthase
MVYLVGAGPGDPGLLTRRGAELLGRADVVVYDALINPELLKLAPSKAELIYGGKRSRRHALLQGELNELLVEKAKEGKTVVRLKGGDPYTFGRGGEEGQQLAASGVAFEIVPGISSVVAALNYAGIPLTHREYCSSFTVITGHEEPDAEGSGIDWQQLAQTPGTKVVLMGLNNIRQIMRKLIQCGLAESTPVAMVRWGTLPRQQTITGTVATIAGEIERTGFGAPAVTVIGDVVRLREELNWFERRPLFGERVVVTRARDQAAALPGALSELGAEVLEVPTIRTEAPLNRTALVEALSGLGSYDWLVFTSANGVTCFFEYFFKAFRDVRDIGGVRIAAVGPVTAAHLAELHLQVDLMPEKFEAAAVVKAFMKRESLDNLKICLLRAEQGTPELPRLLEENGAIVDDVPVYRTVSEPEASAEAAESLHSEGAGWLTFTSGSTVEHFHQRFDLLELMRRHPRMGIASIGPETSRVLRQLGAEPTVEAEPHTMAGLVDAIQQVVERRRAELSQAR